jgi:glycosyltransferase involved in cell wall biosynthesis
MIKPERVLWLSDYFPRPHDMTTGVWSMKTALAVQKQGVDVVVLSPTPWIPKPMALTSELKGWSRTPHEFQMGNLPVFYPKCPHYPHHLIRKYVYAPCPSLESKLIWRWCKKTVARLRISHPFQIIHANFMFPCGYIGEMIKQKWGIPLVFHERSTPRLHSAIQFKAARNLYRKVLEDADSVITLNRSMANLIQGISPRLKEINIIRAVGDSEACDSLSENKPVRYGGKKIILSVGALTERKGHEYLLKAISRLRTEIQDIKCIIIGSGILANHLKTLVEKLSLNDIVELYGKRSHDEVLRTMSWCDVFVLPSWDEAFGTVYSEAMTFGKPVIGCEGEGIGEVIRNGVHGFLVKKRDDLSLYAALNQILCDGNLAAEMGKEAKILSERELNYSAIASKIVDIYCRSVMRAHG